MQHTLEKAMLKDIRERTGLSFVQIDAIDTQSKPIADAVLPILEEWIGSITDQSSRGAIFYKFATPHAAPFMDSLLEWWRAEEDQIDASWLTQAIVAAARPSHAERIWRIAQNESEKPFYFMLLSKLATFPSVSREVTEVLVKELSNGAIPTFELQHVGRVDDPRIRRWFEDQVESPDANVRKQARRVAARKAKLPPNFAFSQAAPDRLSEVLSAEIDLGDLRATLEKIANQLGVRIPAALKATSFLDSVPLNQWVCGGIKTIDGKMLELWLRLEDVDTIEIVVIRSHGRHSTVALQYRP